MKGRKGRAMGGDATVGTKEYEQDLARKNMRYTADSNVNSEAEERKRGGKAVGKAEGMAGKKHAGRAARKSGGRAGSNYNPLSSAASGTAPKGRKIEMN
jgi:hypothetical protein